MITSNSLTCNSLRAGHFLRLGVVMLSNFTRRKLPDLFTKELLSFFQISSDRVFLFGAARMGLYIFLKSLKLTENDEVILLGYTCVVVPNAVKYLGLKLKYVDIDESTLNMDTEVLWSAINDDTKVIIIAHNFGLIYDDIHEIKKRFPDIVVIEDAAHAFGSEDRSGKKAGLMGDVSIFSLEYSKPITTGLGGILIINDEKRLGAFRQEYDQIGFAPWLYNFKILITLWVQFLSSNKPTWLLSKVLLRLLIITNIRAASSAKELQGRFPRHYPSRLPGHLAYLGYLQMKEIERSNRIKKEMAALYFDALKRIPYITQYYDPTVVFVRYPLVFNKEVTVDEINAVRKRLADINVQTGDWFNDVVHPKGSFRYAYVEKSCPTGESVSKRIINLPLNIRMALDDKLLNGIRDCFKVNLMEAAT